MQTTDLSRPTKRKFVVLGIGNTLMSDDGVGIHVIRNLQQRQGRVPRDVENVEILDGGTLGYLLIDRVSCADGLIIVDAANLCAAPGTVRVIDDTGIERYLEDNPSSSVHEVGLIDLLQMMSLSDSQPRLRALVGIQPALVDWGTDLSAAVAESVFPASQAVESIIAEWTERVESCPN